MCVTYSPEVRCAGCSHLRDRNICREVGGLLYGPECFEKARDLATWWCQVCGSCFPEESMATAFLCKFCESGQ